jgi:hypothetical protein
MSTTVSTLLAYCEQKTQAGTGTLNGANGISFLNEALIDFRGEMIKRGVDASQTQEAYVGSVSVPAAGNGSTFAYPSDMFALKTIEVNMQDTNTQNYIRATQLDVANIPGQQSFSWLRLNQPSVNPLFDDRGDTYEIFPAFASGMNTTNAIRLFYYLNPTPYTSTSDTLVYPDSIDWYILATRVCSLYYESLSKFSEADYWRELYVKKMMSLNTTLGRGSQQPIEPIGLQISGWEF